jgi:hypothetical protein
MDEALDRVWVVQELSLAKEVIFRFGLKEISYDRFRVAKFFYTLYLWSILSKIQLGGFMNPIEIQKILTALQSTNRTPVTSMLAGGRKY